jgi:hypothetical protein
MEQQKITDARKTTINARNTPAEPNEADALEKACSMCSGTLVTDASGDPVFCDDCWYALSCD